MVQSFKIYLPEFNVYLPDFNIISQSLLFIAQFLIFTPPPVLNRAENISMTPMGYRRYKIPVKTSFNIYTYVTLIYIF